MGSVMPADAFGPVAIRTLELRDGFLLAQSHRVSPPRRGTARPLVLDKNVLRSHLGRGRGAGRSRSGHGGFPLAFARCRVEKVHCSPPRPWRASSPSSKARLTLSWMLAALLRNPARGKARRRHVCLARCGSAGTRNARGRRGDARPGLLALERRARLLREYHVWKRLARWLQLGRP
jgi:hypothetical protein